MLNEIDLALVISRSKMWAMESLSNQAKHIKLTIDTNNISKNLAYIIIPIHQTIKAIGYPYASFSRMESNWFSKYEDNKITYELCTSLNEPELMLELAIYEIPEYNSIYSFIVAKETKELYVDVCFIIWNTNNLLLSNQGYAGGRYEQALENGIRL